MADPEQRRTLTAEVHETEGAIERKVHLLLRGSLGLPSQRIDDVGRGYSFDGRRGIDALDQLLRRGERQGLVEHLSQAALLKAGELLFELLFGPDEAAYEPCFERLFGEHETAPTRHPVRLRVLTTSPRLLSMPWGIAAWRASFLRDFGWTFEIARELAEGADEDLRLPTGVLLILPELMNPDDRLQTAHHRAAIEEVLDDYFPGFSKTRLLRVAATREEVIDAIVESTPGLVYFYGHGDEAEDGQPYLRVRARRPRAGDGGDRWNVHDVVRALCAGSRRPSIVYLNGCMTGRGGFQSIAMRLLDHLPAVLAHATTAYSRPASEMAIRWLRSVLSDEGDPIRAAMARGLDEPTTGYAWLPLLSFGRFRTFTIRYSQAPRTRPKTANDLDRHRQRKDAFATVLELVQNGTRRVQAFIVPGPPDNYQREVADQLHRYILDRDTHCALLVKKPLDVSRGQLEGPAGSDGLSPIELIEGRLKVNLHHDWRARLEDVLRAHAPPRVANRHRILWLDFGVLQRSRLAEELRGWLAFGAGRLTQACPGDLFVVVSLSIEVASDKLHKLVRGLHELVNDTTYRSDMFRCAVLDPLGPADLDEIVDFLDDVRCPANIRDDLARWMMLETDGGAYAPLRGLITRGLEATWVDLHHELGAKYRGKRPLDDLG